MANSFFQNLRSGIKNFDDYGHHVLLTYKGSTKYKTFFGGTVSSMVRIVIIYYIYTQLLVLANREFYVIVTTFHSNVIDNPNLFILAK